MEHILEAFKNVAPQRKGEVLMDPEHLYTGSPTEDLPSILTAFEAAYDQALYTVSVSGQGTEVERVWAA
jgi:hypothetical protein